MSNPESSSTSQLPVWRLNVLRIFYLLIAFGMGLGVWQQLLHATPDWPLMRGVAKALLAALALLCLMGIRRPLQMLPMLLFEIGWKMVWILMIALPAWQASALTADQRQTFFECIAVVVLIALFPWRYFWSQYIRGSAEPWR